MCHNTSCLPSRRATSFEGGYLLKIAMEVSTVRHVASVVFQSRSQSSQAILVDITSESILRQMSDQTLGNT
ncbi:hypothetical protein A0J61_01802 [Choanephora cucurbitarum]|uniref:Uncharacterized protein n=1 Tax=Choanephora cucurbitarum TaxID=101091 RepID=A0A1C7NNW5_9FUNG|nr:hypothetical protein A0J61_01802 [Choanephora cucurbitarum]